MVIVEEAQKIIDTLGLKPLLPEGGWFKRFWYKKGEVSQIFFMLTEGDFSEFHILPYQEQYIFLSGHRVDHYTGVPDSESLIHNVLGQEIHKGEKLNLLVEPETYQALRLVEGGKWALMSTVMSPSYETEYYKSVGLKEMTSHFPDQGKLIKELTRF